MLVVFAAIQCATVFSATAALPQEWWASTFAEAIALIGHTVMLLSPWDAPFALTRVWCLFEIWATASTGTPLRVLLPSAGSGSSAQAP